MAIYHLSMKNISRVDGRSAVACASYRSGEELHDERTGSTFQFKRQDRVAHTEIIAPAFAPDWVSDRAQLWNSVEASEKRKDARLSREFQIGLPNELSLSQQRELLSGWVAEQITPLGLVADVAIHLTPVTDEPNDHAHVMTTPRAIETDGGWAEKKDSSLNSKEQLEQWRASWAVHANSALERAGEESRIDHRSNKARGIETLPTIHEGYKHQAIEKRGGRSWRVELNRQIRQTNLRILEGIKARVTAKYREFTRLAQKLTADAISPELTPAAQTPAAKKQEPVPARPAAKPEPTSLAEMLPLMRPDKLTEDAEPEPTLAPKPVLQWPLMRPDKLPGGPADTAPKPVLQPPPMRPDKLPGGAAYTAPNPAPKKPEPVPAPVLQPPPMRPDKVPGGAAYTAPTPAPAPILQPPPMRPDKLAPVLPVLQPPPMRPDKVPMPAPPPALQPPSMMPDKVAIGPSDKAVQQALQPPPQMMPDKVAIGPSDQAVQQALQPPSMMPDKVAIGLAQTTGLELTPWDQSPAAKKEQKPAPPPIEAKPQPAKLPEMPAIAILDAEAEKRKKDAYNLAARFHQGGGSGVGG